MNLSNGQLLEVLSGAPDATLIVDASGRIVFASDRVEAVLGFPPSELIGRQVEVLIPAALRARHARHRSAYQGAPQIRPMGAGLRLRGRRRDGREIPVEISLSPIQVGETPHVICAIRDITEHLALEDALQATVRRLEERVELSDADAREHAEHLRLFVEHAPAAVVMFDRDLRYLIVSRRWLDDYGLTRADIVDKTHYELFPELPDRWREAHARCLAGEALEPQEDSFVRWDGQVDWLRWELHPWKGPRGEVGGVMLFSEVVTARRRAELALAESHERLEERVTERTVALNAAKREAEHATASKSRFLAAASHDLRQPLHATSIYLAALARRIEQPELLEVVQKARQPLKAMADILDILLEISRLESGSVTPQPRLFEVDDLFARVMSTNLPHAEAKQLRLTASGDGRLAFSDPVLLERVIENFVSNAIRYTRYGAVALSCEPVGGLLRLCVSDTGVGISAEALPDIFDDYVQLDNPTRDRRKGLGLGLSIAKHVADALGHRIEVASTPGAGSMFSILVPLEDDGRGAEAAEAFPAAPTAQPPSPRPPPTPAAAQPRAEAAIRVLLIDDDPAVIDSTLMVLQLDGLEGHAASNGDEALALIADGLRPHVVVSDFRLPGYDGAEAIRRIRQGLGQSLPAFLITGDTGLRGVAPDEDCPILHKPVDPDRLCELIRARLKVAAQSWP